MALSHTYTQPAKTRTKKNVECKPKGCPTCGAQDCIERPRFFCGQLLTDKDLDAAQRYVIEKNKLHNRYLVGTGVVCGLAVRCAPCEEGGVVVEPGYAIDCCGNDIVLCEPAEFNVTEYIEECFKPQGPDCNDKIRVRKTRCDDGPKEYCLFVSYSEEPSRPITAMIRDNGCKTSRCEPSRIKETFRFDLVEKSDLPGDSPNLWTKLAEFLPIAGKKMGAKAAEYYALEKLNNNPAALSYAHRDLMRSVRSSILDLYRKGPNIRCDLEDPEPKCPTVQVTAAPTVVAGSPATFTAVLTGTDPNVTPTYNWSVTVGTITSGQGTPTITVATPAGSAGRMTATVEVLGYPAECGKLVASGVTDIVAPTFGCPTVTVNCPSQAPAGDPVTFTAVITGGDPNVTPTYNWSVTVGTITSGQGTKTITVATPAGLAGRMTAVVEVGGYPPECNPLVAFGVTDLVAPTTFGCPVITVNCPGLASGGEVVTFTAVITGGDPAVVPSFSWTISAGTITSGQGTSSITVDTGSFGLSSVTATVQVGGYPQQCDTIASCVTSFNLILSPPPNIEGFAPAGLGQPNTEVAELGEILSPYFQYIIDSFCDALLVPCTPCVGPEGVLIACVTVENGKVIRICNIARTQVITGPALRYKLGPLFTKSNKLLELACCGLEMNKLSRWTPGLFAWFRKAFASSKKAFGGIKPSGAFAGASYTDAFARAGKVFSATARMAANVAMAKLGDVRNLGHVVNPETKLGGEFFGLNALEARATLARMNVDVVEEMTATTSEETDTLTNLRAMVAVVQPGSKVEIVKGPDGRVVAVRAPAKKDS